MPHKKRVLLRWQESGIDNSTNHKPSSSSSDVKVQALAAIGSSQATLNSRKSSLTSTVSSSEAQEDKAQDSTTGSGYNHPDFFDNILSDDEEFELVGVEKHGLDRNSEGVEESGDVEGVGGEGGRTREGPRTPTVEEEEEDVKSLPRPALLEKQNSSLSSISDASLQSSDGGMEGEDGAVTPPPTPPPPAASTPATNISDISSDMDQSATRSDPSIHETKLQPSEAEMEGFLSTSSHQTIVTPLAKEIGDGTCVSESPHSPGSQEGSNLEPEEKLPTGDLLALVEVGGREKGGIDEESGEGTVGEGLMELMEPSRQLLPQDRASGSPEKMASGASKTPGKRKVDSVHFTIGDDVESVL